MDRKYIEKIYLTRGLYPLVFVSSHLAALMQEDFQSHLFEIKEDIMILINKEESEQIRSKFPYAHIVRTMKQNSKRHRYYCEESPKVISYINEIRTDVEVYSSEHN